MTSEQLEAVVRDQLSRVIAITLQLDDVPPLATFDRATGAILDAAAKYAFTAFVAVHYKPPSSNRSACGRGLGGRTDPRQVTCASCTRTRSYRAALREVAA